MFIMDTSNYRVLRWIVGDPLGYTVAGGNGNGGASTQIGASYGLFIDDQYNVYVSEQTNHRITLWLSSNPSIGNIVIHSPLFLLIISSLIVLILISGCWWKWRR